MFKLKRVELDDLGQAAVRAVKTIEPQLTSHHLQKIFVRLYLKYYRENKLEQEPPKQPVKAKGPG